MSVFDVRLCTYVCVYGYVCACMRVYVCVSCLCIYGYVCVGECR